MSQNQIQTANPPNAMLTVQNHVNTLSELEAYWKIAEKAHQSGLTKVNSIFDAFFLVGYGNELGISPFSALRTIYVVNGVPTCSGEMMLALIRRSGLLASNQIEELLDNNGKFIGAKCTMTRKDTNETISIAFTLEDAKTAGLMGKSVWKSYPKNMCRWRAVSNVAKLLFGDVIGGLYTFEEIAHDNQQIDESGAPVGEIVEGTIEKPNQSTSNDDKTIQFPNNDDSSGAGQADDQPGEATTWLQIPDNKQWLYETMVSNGLDFTTFFKQIDPEASSWTDIAKQYKDRKALEKAIFDAMPSDDDTATDDKAEDTSDDPPPTPDNVEPLYPNPFNTDDLGLPGEWIDGAYDIVCSLISAYLSEDGDSLIKGGLGVEVPEQEYSSPLELWQEVVNFARETNVQLVCNQFRVVKSGKSGRIETNHPILAVSYSRTKFAELIGDDQFVDKMGIKDWGEGDQKLHRDLVISYENKVHGGSGKTYSNITSASIKPLDEVPADADLDQFFDN